MLDHGIIPYDLSNAPPQHALADGSVEFNNSFLIIRTPLGIS